MRFMEHCKNWEKRSCLKITVNSLRTLLRKQALFLQYARAAIHVPLPIFSMMSFQIPHLNFLLFRTWSVVKYSTLMFNLVRFTFLLCIFVLTYVTNYTKSG